MQILHSKHFLIPVVAYTQRTAHARTLLPAASASVSFETGPKGPEKYRANSQKYIKFQLILDGANKYTCPSGHGCRDSLFRALRMFLKKRVPFARRGGGVLFGFVFVRVRVQLPGNTYLLAPTTAVSYITFAIPVHLGLSVL